MRNHVARLAGTLGLATILAGPLQAQTAQLHLGPRLSYHVDLEELGIGGQFSVPMGSYLEFYPSFDSFFVEEGSFWQFNADLKYRVARESANWLYLGSGLNLAHTSRGPGDNTEAGLNLLAGAESLRGRVHPFGEVRFTLRDGSTAQIVVGLNFTLR